MIHHFEVATPASTALQTMAEGGNIAPLVDEATAANSDMVANSAEGLLAPAASTMASLTTTEGNDYLSLTAMLLPTNDGFVGLNSWKIPTEAGTYTIYLNGYMQALKQMMNALLKAQGLWAFLVFLPHQAEMQAQAVVVSRAVATQWYIFILVT